MPVSDDPCARPGSPRQTLREVFGYADFRPHQEEIVEHVVEGGDAFVLMPTGGGKSLCYQIPALHRHGVGIVVSPLISLMKDQVDALCANGVRAAFYNSSLETEEARRVLARLHGSDLDNPAPHPDDRCRAGSRAPGTFRRHNRGLSQKTTGFAPPVVPTPAQSPGD